MTSARRSPITQLLTLSEAAGRLGLPTSAVSTLIRDGVFEKLRVSVDGWRLRPGDLDAYALSRAGHEACPAVAPDRAESSTGRHTTVATGPAPLPGRPQPLAIRRLGVTPPAARWPRVDGLAANTPAAFLAFPDTARALEYLRTCAGLATTADARTSQQWARSAPVMSSPA